MLQKLACTCAELCLQYGYFIQSAVPFMFLEGEFIWGTGWEYTTRAASGIVL